jgi:hypothetical protein
MKGYQNLSHTRWDADGGSRPRGENELARYKRLNGRGHDIQGPVVPGQVCKKTGQRLLRLSGGNGCLLRAGRHEGDEDLCWHRRARRC